MKRLFSFFLCLLLLLSGCAAREAQVSSSRYLTAMDTVMTLTAYGKDREEALDKAEAEILRLDILLSVGSEDSEISLLNQQGSLTLSQDTAYLLGRALALSRETGGLFDVTVYPLVKLWGFFDQQYHVPTEAELAQALPLVDYSAIAFDRETGAVTLGAGQQIDLGGIGKGYTSQRLTQILTEAGVSSAILSLGGNVQCLGTKPDGSPWNIGIRDPWDQNGALYAAVKVEDKAVITSGGYERYFQDPETGRVYRHILDPRTGCPAESGLSSVTIITPDGTLGDGLSTALYIMGLETAAGYWRAHSAEFEAILITDDGTLYATQGLSGSLSSEREIHYITPQTNS